MPDFTRRGMVAALLAVAIFTLSRPAECARQPRPNAGQAVRQAVQAPPVSAVAIPNPATPLADADDAREALRRVLAHYSPTVGRVLALDPLLLQNPVYLEPYPELAAFLQQHPEVARNASYYLSGLTPSYYVPPDRETQMLRMWSSLFEGMAIFMVIGVVTGTLIWLVKTFVDYRRWYRLSKVQTEAHNKLLDRFTANEELMAYISTPSGKRFLESAPIMLDTANSSIASPLRRILWAIEIGLVVASGGCGLLVARSYVPAELGQALSVVAVFAIALGVGFVLAAAASYLLSWRLGVLGSAASRNARETDAHPAA